MTKKKEMRRVDTIEGDDPWLAYWRWWYSDRPEARLELKLNPQPRQQSRSLRGFKTLLQKRLTRLSDTLEHEHKISH